MRVAVFDEKRYEQSEEGLHEVLVRQGGVRVQPEPMFCVDGLDEHQEYSVKIRFELVDEFRYTFENEKWSPASSSSPNANFSKSIQIETRKAKGSVWNQRVVQFEELRITTDTRDVRRNMIYVEPNHKYFPIVSVCTSDNLCEFRFDQLAFMVVTEYTNAARREQQQPSLAMTPPSTPDSSSQEDHAPPPPPKKQSVVMHSYMPYSYGYGAYYNYDYYRYYPHVPFPVSYPMMVPFAQPVSYWPQRKQQQQYVPKYGWNSILVPSGGGNGAVCEGDETNRFAHEIWAPQKMELEKLYFQTEQNYQPLVM